MVGANRTTGFVLISLFLIAGLDAPAQHLLHHPDAYYAPAPGSEKYFYDLQNEKDTEQDPGPRIQYRLDVGTAYNSFGGAVSFMSSYLSPSIRYRVSPKLNLYVGGTIVYNHAAGSNSASESFMGSGNDPSYQFHLYGNYHVTDKLVVDGSFTKTKMNQLGFGLYPYRMNSNYESYSLGINYRVANSFHIGAQINVSNGMNPYYFSDPFSPGRFNSYDPFYRKW